MSENRQDVFSGSGFQDLHIGRDAYFGTGQRDRTARPDCEDIPPPTEHWQGRADERRQLAAWIAELGAIAIAIVGMGGMGKSTLAAKLYEETDIRFWVDLGRSPANFATVARQVLRRLDGCDPEGVPETQLAIALVLPFFPLFLVWIVALLLWRSLLGRLRRH